MSKPATKQIKQQRSELTARQELDSRTIALRHTNKILKRLAAFSVGELTKKELDDKGNMVEVPETISAQELKAAEIVLKKTLPDLSAVQLVESDDFENMSRDELMESIAAMVSNRPELLKMPDVLKTLVEDSVVDDQ